MTDVGVPELLAVSSGDRDVEWLRRSLQVAVELELSTIPPYLCGLWSIDAPDGKPPKAYSLVLSVVLEEMVHMGLACNMLAAVGGTPRMRVPAYPGGMPGGVRPGLSVYLSGLTKDVLRDVYLQIEWPEIAPIPVEIPGLTRLGGEPTIGQFYDQIDQAFDDLPESVIRGERQLTTSFDEQDNEVVYPIKTRADAHRAIREVKDQGEGTAKTPDAPGFHELAHFYRFGELYMGKTLIKVAPNRWAFAGDPVPFPRCLPMARVPAGGYPKLNEAFSGLFTSVLANLETAWVEGGPPADGQSFLQNGVNVMFDLKPEAVKLMGMPISPPGAATYGPDFQLASATPPS